MAAPRTLKPEYLPSALRYAKRFTQSDDIPEDPQEFIAWSMDNIPAKDWRRLQSSVRQVHYRRAKRKADKCATDSSVHAFNQADLDKLLLNALDVADKLALRSGGLSRPQAVDRLRAVVHAYAEPHEWKAGEASERLYRPLAEVAGKTREKMQSQGGEVVQPVDRERIEAAARLKPLVGTDGYRVAVLKEAAKLYYSGNGGWTDIKDTFTVAGLPGYTRNGTWGNLSRDTRPYCEM